jgi:hypothetical protein
MKLHDVTLFSATVVDVLDDGMVTYEVSGHDGKTLVLFDAPAVTSFRRKLEDAMGEQIHAMNVEMLRLEREVEHLRHMLYDAAKWLPEDGEVALAVLKHTADAYADGEQSQPPIRERQVCLYQCRKCEARWWTAEGQTYRYHSCPRADGLQVPVARFDGVMTVEPEVAYQ